MDTELKDRYLNPVDLKGRRVRLVMSHIQGQWTLVATRPGKSERRLVAVLFFKGLSKGLMLNKLNAEIIVDAYGDTTDRWIGQPVQLFVVTNEDKGRKVDVIRVAVSEAKHFAIAPAIDSSPRGSPSSAIAHARYTSARAASIFIAQSAAIHCKP